MSGSSNWAVFKSYTSVARLINNSSRSDTEKEALLDELRKKKTELSEEELMRFITDLEKRI